MTEGVFFDAGNTLIYADPPVGEAYVRPLRKRGIEACARDLEVRFRDAWTTLRRQRECESPPYGSTDAEARQWWRRVVRMTFKPYDVTDEVDLIFEELWAHFASPGAWRVYPDAVPALSALKERGLAVGLISNWDSRLPLLLDSLGIWQLLDVAVISFQIGIEKPDPRIFLHALAKGSVPAERAVHVGDSYGEDVLGARAAGMGALWLRRARRTPSEGTDPMAVGSLAEIPGLLH